MKKIILLIILVALVSQIATGAELEGYEYNSIFINSKEWTDVYSGMLAASLTDVEASFAINEVQTPFIINKLQVKGPVLLIESNNPVLSNVKGLLESKGFEVVMYKSSSNINLELFEDLNLNNAIVVDSNYGYDAISVTPYATIKESFVLFINENNLGDYDLDGLNELILYGYLDTDVTSEYSSLDPTIIDKGSRFDNNIEITKRFLAIKDTKQTIMTNGEFIEKSLFKGNFPILFIGKSRAPDQVVDYLARSELTTATLVGNDLSVVASNVKRQIKVKGKEFTIMLMIGKTTTGNQGYEPIEMLDMFPITTYDANIKIDSIKYNKLDNQIFVTLENLNDLRVYFLPSISINGTDITIKCEEGTLFLEGSRKKTFVCEPSNRLEGNEKGQILIPFGDTPTSLDALIDYNFENLNSIEIEDDSNIKLNSVVYDRLNKAFVIEIENTGEVEAYTYVQLNDVIVDGRKEILTSRAINLQPSEKNKVKIRAQLSPLDIEENVEVKLKAYYGQREEVMFKILFTDLELGTTMHPAVYIVPFIIIVVIIIFLSLRKKKKKIK